MAKDTQYSPLEMVYKSRGLAARWAYDQVPDGYFIQFMNMLERDEESLSSRYGYSIVNRDPNGTSNGQNYFFTSPVTSLARLAYAGSAFRYAGLQNGELYRREGNGQGPYSLIYSGLSGNPFEFLVSNCFYTSQAYMFIADEDVSLKDVGTGTPQLWGIDPPDQTANAIPYSPLLTLIDNFASGNSYSASGFASSWSFAPVTNIPAGNGSIVTDFPQFINLSAMVYSLAGGTAATSSGLTGPTTSNTVFSGFASEVVSADETVNLSVTFYGSILITSSPGVGNGYILYQYSVNGGTTWETFYTSAGTASINFAAQTVTVSVPGVANLDNLQIGVFVQANNISGKNPSGTITTAGTITAIAATISDAGIFGLVCDGILSNLNTNSSINIPIASIASSGFSDNAYQTLTILTTRAHGLTGTPLISVYGSSNDLVDGFYKGTVATATTITVPFYSVAPIGATGGFLHGGAASPAECILTDEYSTPYPTQLSAMGFYQQVPLTASNFPVGSFEGVVDASATASVGVSADFDLSINNQVTDSDLIVLTLNIGSPENIANIRLQFDVNGSGYTSSYYYANIAPSYYQGNIANQVSAYDTTQNQILADALGLITGQPPSTTTAQLQPSNFSTGSGTWVAVLIPRGNFLRVGSAGQSGLDWTNITGWQVVFETSPTGSSVVACNGLYLQWGYGPSSFAGVGYDYRYTYFNAATYTESSPSPEMEFNPQYGYLASLTAPFYLRQAVQVTGPYSTDSQVTHVRIYRRGGIYENNWLLIDQIPAPPLAGSLANFAYKDVVPDASLSQAQPLVLDNDPPVTSSLVNPILTTLSQATTGPGNSVFSTFSPQWVYVLAGTFVPNQTVLVGNAFNLEEVLVVAGGTNQFSAVVRLQHNAGEPVQVNSVPRVACNLCALAYGQVWLAGDPNNPHYLYYSKKSYPENFGPENYIPVSSPDDPIMAVINWRGTLVVTTLKTWYVIVGGASPYPQPTGSTHGLIAQQGWTLAEGEIWYRANDGQRAFSGADGKYMTLPVEWIYRTNPDCIVPQVSASDASLDVMAFFNNLVITSYVSQDLTRYRLIYDTVYARFRQDDIEATAMLWERDTNQLLCGVQIGIGYAVVADQQYNQDYDDGGWYAGNLTQSEIFMTEQSPYKDLGRPHFPKQWNALETDCDTQNQTLETTLLFDSGEEDAISLPSANTAFNRSKVQFSINSGDGQQSYSMSILHQMSVTVAPTLFQENIYAALLADYRATFDTYWHKFGSDELHLVKEAYFDYTSPVPVTFNLYVNGDMENLYFTFTLPVLADRAVVRVLFPAYKCRLWRMVGLLASGIPDAGGGLQLWSPVRVNQKVLEDGSAYARQEFGVYG